MNRKQKIIVSIVGITIVILALVGITYAYFLTRINGNTNTKSIEVTTADLKLEYNDGRVEILTKDNITPGDEIGSKDFTITNKGESKVTGYVIYLEDVTNTFTNTNDIVYTLTCTSSDSNTCNGVSETAYPTGNKILVTNDIEPNVIHSYVLTIQYKETNTDQSIDMNKTISGKVNLYDAKSLNPYATSTASENEKSLAYNIINNANTIKNETNFAKIPLTSIGHNIQKTNQKELLITEDDLGNSYYYRGSVVDNYINYSGMCWRIVRIEGDGSIKLILANATEECSSNIYSKPYGIYIGMGDYGYKEDGTADYLNEAGRTTSMNYVFDKFMNSGGVFNFYNYDEDTEVSKILNPIDQSKIKIDDWCLQTNSDITNPTLKCNAEVYQNSIATLTVNEIIYAGGSSSSYGFYYLDQDFKKNTLGSDYDDWMTLTPASTNTNYIVSTIMSSNNDFPNASKIKSRTVTEENGLRPAITLISGVKITDGDGTIEYPYNIDMN